MKKSLPIILFLLLLATTAFSQTGTASGTVVNVLMDMKSAAADCIQRPNYQVVQFRFAGDPINHKWYVLRRTDLPEDYYKEYLTLILSSANTGKKLKVSYFLERSYCDPDRQKVVSSISYHSNDD